MKRPFRLPAVLSVVVLSGAAVNAIVACGGDDAPPPADAARADATGPDAVNCVNYCFPDGTGTGDECPFPTCATGPASDVCPEHCSIGI